MRVGPGAPRLPAGGAGCLCCEQCNVERDGQRWELHLTSQRSARCGHMEIASAAHSRPLPSLRSPSSCCAAKHIKRVGSDAEAANFLAGADLPKVLLFSSKAQPSDLYKSLSTRWGDEVGGLRRWMAVCEVDLGGTWG